MRIIGDKISSIKLVIEIEIVHAINTYARQFSLDKEIKRHF